MKFDEKRIKNRPNDEMLSEILLGRWSINRCEGSREGCSVSIEATDEGPAKSSISSLDEESRPKRKKYNNKNEKRFFLF